MPRFIRRIIVFFAALATIALLGAVAVVAFLFHSNTAPAALPSPFPQVDGVSLEDGGLRFEVRRGETARSVGSRLAAAGIIRNRYFWDLLGRMRDDHIRIGSYLIEFPMSQMAIRGLLEEGRDELVRVTVREGATLRATALVMEEAGLVRAEDFIAAASSPEMLARFGVPGETMEGYLFPDTYIFPLGFSAERIVAAMAENFFARLAALYDGSQALTPEALHEIVILASIVEKEYRVADEAAVMAGGFTNRLNRGNRLESCATVVDIITEKLGRA
ncbi:MAG: endolytic transglycosylase MltG, partial [Treponema sp.]|nr:endolytic transglycosylase MltG [Treponema sp.]